MDKRATTNLINDTFLQDFEINRFQRFIKELFNDIEITPNTWEIWREYRDYIQSYQMLASYTDTSKRVIDVLTVKLKRASSRDRARTMQRNFVAKYLGNTEKDAAIVAFYGEDPGDWRFSFVKMEPRLMKGEKGKLKVEKELTPAKRYSFLVGINEPNHTCRKQFLDLVMEEKVNPSLDEIEAAFSIDNVTKEFFEEYKELYLSIKESLERIIKENDHIKKEFEEKNISTIDFSKKLLGQIVFLYFLQKKGWLGVESDKETGKFMKWGTGPKKFLQQLFEKRDNKNFFNDILEPLFYEALATERDEDYYSRFNCKIPFLNGGLFEPINDYDWVGTHILLDNSIFEKVLNTFDRFNFTIKEDEPLEKEVAIDPEMLGKVFENLLEIRDRKSKGSFYTPREIVHYMCQQSLINYLETNTDIPQEDIDQYIQLQDFGTGEDLRNLQEFKKIEQDMINGRGADIKVIEKRFQETIDKLTLPLSIIKNKEKIDGLLASIKVVDPAVGSGAFPVGMMNEIVKARSVLTLFFDEADQKKRTIYNLKRDAIENSLYGVDIDSSAVDIAKLRFWLSLIVDEVDRDKIKHLPNLDHKIMCGNSLLEEFNGLKLFDERILEEIDDSSPELEQIKASMDKLNLEFHDIYVGKRTDDGRSREIQKELKRLKRKKQEFLSTSGNEGSQVTLDDAQNIRVKESQRKLNELRRLQGRFFNEKSKGAKRRLWSEIESLEWDLIEETVKEEGNIEALRELQKHKQDNSKPFFLWKLYFSEVFQRENPGFDVVIANPPYVQLQKMKDEAKILEKSGYDVFTKTGDIYALFYEKGVSLLNEKGVLVFISSNTWMRTKFGEKLRKFFIQKTNPHILINFEDAQIFSSVTVETNIIVLQKDRWKKELKAVCIKKDYSDYVSIKQYLDDKHVILDNLDDGPWIIIPKQEYLIKKRIEEMGTPIRDCDVSINYGIKTGFNDAFFLDKKTRDELIKKDPKNQEIIKPLIRGRNIGRYYYEFDNLWLINTHNGLAKKGLQRVDVEADYPLIYGYLKKFEDKLKPRADQGDHWTNLRNCAYLADFDKEKIIWLAITDKPKFALDVGFYVTAPAYFMTSGCNKYLIAILNSKISGWYLDKVTSS
ncbi:Eco57I restriction-modification methylase domain-containing protein, partial [bacterium]|nr:Eco57I restriction-modification methylase domain-containing protein [bacterium]